MMQSPVYNIFNVSTIIFWMATNPYMLSRSQSSGQVDIADLTWEQREKVLRYLFARMNGTTRPPISKTIQKSDGVLMAAKQLPITQSGEVAG